MINFPDVFFLALAFLAIVSAAQVVLSKNPIQSALYLVLVFFASSGLWIMLNAEFLGLILLLIYIGAVMTLFLFVVMTVHFDIKHTAIRFGEILLSLVLIAVFLLALSKALHGFTPLVQTSATLDPSNTHRLGTLVYTDYLYAFEIAGVLLLCAIIAAITLNGQFIDRKRKIVDPAKQIAVQAKDRLKIVSMAAEKRLDDLSPPSA